MLLSAALGNSRAQLGGYSPQQLVAMQRRVQRAIKGVQSFEAGVEGRDDPNLWGGATARQCPQEGQEIEVEESEYHDLAYIARTYEIYNLESLAHSCGMKALEFTQEGGHQWISLVTARDERVVAAAANDCFKSGRHLLTYSLAKFVLARGLPMFQIDLNLAQREAEINRSGVFDHDHVRHTYHTYVKLMNQGSLEQDPRVVSMAELRDPETGEWEPKALFRAVVDHGDATDLVIHDVDEKDIPELMKIQGYTIYFQAPKPYTANSWVQGAGNVRFARRQEFPPGCAVNDTKWIVIGHDQYKFELHPLVPGPECDRSVHTILAALEDAERMDMLIVPNKIEHADIPTMQQVPNDAEMALKAIPSDLRPKTEDYALLAEAIRIGQKGSLMYIEGAGIHSGNKEIFGDCLNSGGLPKTFRKALSEINRTENPLITRYHKYVTALSSAGMIQEPGRVPKDPAKVAIWQMVRSYNAAGLHPSATLDYAWCLEV